MPEQLLLLDVPSIPVPRGNWFLALRPAPHPDVLAHLRQLTRELRHTHALEGKPLHDDRFHVSLHKFRPHVVTRRDLIDQVCATVAETQPPLEIVFDRVASFSGGLGKFPLVLWGDRGSALQDFHRRLGATLSAAGLGHFASRFTPHVTLLYDAKPIPDQSAPSVSWIANELFLVQSLTGQGRHVIHGQWTFRG